LDILQTDGFLDQNNEIYDDADWFMKADDDTYVILENLRYFLRDYKSSDPVYFGHHFKTIVKQGYYSGGAGYVFTDNTNLDNLQTDGFLDQNNEIYSDPKHLKN
jgi:hypothetical protein